jgi:hypothetical protein
MPVFFHEPDGAVEIMKRHEAGFDGGVAGLGSEIDADVGGFDRYEFETSKLVASEIPVDGLGIADDDAIGKDFSGYLEEGFLTDFGSDSVRVTDGDDKLVFTFVFGQYDISDRFLVVVLMTHFPSRITPFWMMSSGVRMSPRTLAVGMSMMRIEASMSPTTMPSTTTDDAMILEVTLPDFPTWIWSTLIKGPSNLPLITKVPLTKNLPVKNDFSPMILLFFWLSAIILHPQFF